MSQTNHEVINYRHELEFQAILHLRLFTNVTNASDLKVPVISGQLPCALIKPKYILDPFQLVVAANKAIVKNNVANIITKSIYTEILFNLSGSKNITQCLSKFGISDNDTDMLVAIITDQANNKEEEIMTVLQQVKGELCPIGDLNKFNSISEIRKLYNIQNEELEISNLLDSVVTRIAGKDYY